MPKKKRAADARGYATTSIARARPPVNSVACKLSVEPHDDGEGWLIKLHLQATPREADDVEHAAQCPPVSATSRNPKKEGRRGRRSHGQGDRRGEPIAEPSSAPAPARPPLEWGRPGRSDAEVPSPAPAEAPTSASTPSQPIPIPARARARTWESSPSEARSAPAALGHTEWPDLDARAAGKGVAAAAAECSRCAAESEEDAGSDEEGEEDDGVMCAICHGAIAPLEVALVRGCDHAFCCACILNWALQKKRCPLCNEAFTHLWLYKHIDGTYNDYLHEESAELLHCAVWFKKAVVTEFFGGRRRGGGVP